MTARGFICYVLNILYIIVLIDIFIVLRIIFKLMKNLKSCFLTWNFYDCHAAETHMRIRGSFVQYQKSDFSMMFFVNISVESSQCATSLYVCDISHRPFLTSQPPNYRNNTLRNLKLIHVEFDSTNENIMTWNLLNFNYADYTLGALCVGCVPIRSNHVNVTLTCIQLSFARSRTCDLMNNKLYFNEMLILTPKLPFQLQIYSAARINKFVRNGNLFPYNSLQSTKRLCSFSLCVLHFVLIILFHACKCKDGMCKLESKSKRNSLFSES